MTSQRVAIIGYYRKCKTDKAYPRNKQIFSFWLGLQNPSTLTSADPRLERIRWSWHHQANSSCPCSFGFPEQAGRAGLCQGDMILNWIFSSMCCWLLDIVIRPLWCEREESLHETGQSICRLEKNLHVLMRWCGWIFGGTTNIIWRGGRLKWYAVFLLRSK